MKGAPHTLQSPHLLAGNGHLHEQALVLFAEVFQGQFRVPMPQI
jgi:hypothetical protein